MEAEKIRMESLKGLKVATAGGLGDHQQILRNMDPFERKKRVAMMQYQSPENFTSRKITSRKEEAEMRRAAGDDSMSPGDYLNISKLTYYDDYEKPKGSIYTQSLENSYSRLDGAEEANATNNTFKLNKQRDYLRGLRFGFIRDKYNKSMSSGNGKLKLTIAMYAIPAVVSFGLALSNYAQ